MDISVKNNISIKDKKIIVIGLARSGVAAANLARESGANVFISDNHDTHETEALLKKLNHSGINGEIGKHSDEIYNTDLWVISPGVPKNAEIIYKATQLNIPIVSEMEFASWFTKAPIIAVTGSNGKTTTVNMIYEMCKTKDFSPVLAGNVGYAFSDAILQDLHMPANNRVFILEVSSFQMEFIQHFKPFISVFLNITPDHLNRYNGMQDYANTKLKLCSNQDGSDWIVYNADDEILNTAHFNSLTSKIPFSLNKIQKALFTVNSTKILNQEHATLILLDEIALPGKHNLSNYLGAATAAALLGIASSSISKVMQSFSGVPHRLEKVDTINGITFINDSKATNVDAVKVALDSFHDPVWLILGGRDKKGDFLSLYPHTHKVKEVLTIGECEDVIATALRDAVRLRQCGSLKSAVEIAYSKAQSGDIVLLSPGCASFDQFDNFEHRGNVFKDLVKALKVRL